MVGGGIAKVPAWPNAELGDLCPDFAQGRQPTDDRS